MRLRRIHLLNHSTVNKLYCNTKIKDNTLFNVDLEESNCITCNKIFINPISDVREQEMTDVNVFRMNKYYIAKSKYKQMQHRRFNKKLYDFVSGLICNYYQLNCHYHITSIFIKYIHDYYVKNYHELPSWKDIFDIIDKRILFTF